MFKYNILYLLILVAGCHFVTSCELYIQNTSPLFTKSLGSKKIVFKPQGSTIKLHISESITAYCNTEVMHNADQRQYESETPPKNVLKLTCNSYNKIAFNNQRNSNKETITVYCKSSTTYDLYESKKRLPNCEKYMSYAIGVPLQNIEGKIIAGLCYDIDKFDLKYMSYVAYRDAATFGEQQFSNEISLNLDELVGSLENYYSFMSERNFNISRDNTQNELFNAFKFDLTSLLQDKVLNNEIKDFDYIFKIMWWRQLRQQNWHHFLKALHDRTQSVKYLVYTGTYGNATLPAPQTNCSLFKNDVVSVTTQDTKIQAPAYIWAYLKPITTAEHEQDIVVINPGHNEFCNVDICDEVDWLKNSDFGNLRRLPTLGYTFCCRPEEVAKIIDYFPISKVETTTQRPKDKMEDKLEVEKDDQWRNI